MKVSDLPREELVYGHLACSGCGGMIAVRWALKVLGSNSIVVIPACCVMAVSCFYPQLPFGVPYLVSSFPGTASALSGVAAALKRKKIKDVNVVGFAGDGGTMDIGLQALSGIVERNEQIIYICYDNEAYMNTGAQRSSGTPLGARTTTTPVGRMGVDEDRPKKDIFSMMVANNIAYAATASVGYPVDYMKKVKKAKETEGTSFIHVLAPCPTGWGIKTEATIDIAKRAVRCGIWILKEYSNGKIRVTKKIKERGDIRDYLKAQGRFRHLDEEKISRIAADIDGQWETILS